MNIILNWWKLLCEINEYDTIVNVAYGGELGSLGEAKSSLDGDFDSRSGMGKLFTAWSDRCVYFPVGGNAPCKMGMVPRNPSRTTIHLEVLAHLL